jgi:DNA-binding transcriptional MerR regulator
MGLPQERIDVSDAKAGEDKGWHSIDDLATRYCVSHRALRFYESLGLLSPSRLGRNRIYDAEDKLRLEMILKGKQLGFTLTEVRQLMGSSRHVGASAFLDSVEPERVQSQISHLLRKRGEIADAIAQLRKVHAKMMG